MVDLLFHRCVHLSALQANCVQQFDFSPHFKEGLLRLGVPEAAFRRCGPIGTVSARYDGYRFEPDPHGIRSLTIAVPRMDGGLLDLVAFARGRCGALDGVAWALGEIDALAPTRLHDTPIDWLRAGGDGLCIVNWHSAPRILQDLEATLVVENEEQRRKVERRLASSRQAKVIVAPRPRLTSPNVWGANP